MEHAEASAIHCSGQPMPKLLPEPGLWKPPEKEAVPQDSIEAAAPMDIDVSHSSPITFHLLPNILLTPPADIKDG